MTAITTGRARPSAVPAPSRPAGLVGTLRSEFTKIRSVRSTYWSLILLVVTGIAWSVAFCAGEAAHWPHMTAQAKAGLDPTQSSIVGLALLGQLVIVVLGTLSITSEYSTGMIRTSLSVMPRRRILYAAKAAVFTAIALVVAFLTSFAAFFIGQALLSSTHASATLSQPNVLRAVTCAALYVALCGLFSFGLGMILRSTAGAIAAALLGDPQILIFDEPVNGLDPEGILWIRNLMKSLAAEGRSVLVFSHLMSEMEYTADHLLVIGRGRLIADSGMTEFIARGSGLGVRVRTPQADALARAVAVAGASVSAADGGGELEICGLTEDQVSDLAFAHGIRLYHLAATHVSLEHAFMELTADSVEYRAELPV